ncbi:aminodeoxychorismate synthase component I [Thermodesulfobacteriota bacterium]
MFIETVMAAEIILYNNFIKEWIRFGKPDRTFMAVSLDEVMPVLEKVETMVARGLYAAGFVSYEAAPAFDPALKVDGFSTFPFCWFGLYQSFDIIDLNKCKRSTCELGEWVPSFDRRNYHQNIERIKDFIAAGETYQVNYTYRLHATFKGDPFSFFLDLSNNQKTDYAAFLDIGDYAICSVSPELFFELNGKTITSKPMKGTAPRGRYLDEDKNQIDRLYWSTKNRAENIMIVDMVRNDLARIAETGTVQVKSLYDIERLQTAFQMTSTVTAQTIAPISQIMSALFPCASITGAPKPRTMGIINGLETTPRNLYTGCIGFITPKKKAQFNVSIRTVLIDRKASIAEYGVGGGIVWDSTAGDEFEESLTKARVLKEKYPVFDLLETLLWQQGKGFFLLEYHLKRMRQSAAYFDFRYNENTIVKELERCAKRFADKSYRIRLIVNRDGRISCQSRAVEISASKQPVRLKPSRTIVNSSNSFLYHKTTFRDVYELSKKNEKNCDDVILLNENNEVTETSIYNIVINVNGNRFTPPIACGLLPGTFRAWLLDRNIIQEKRLTLPELESCDDIYVVNSVRKWQKAVLV